MATSPTGVPAAHFDINAAVVFRLGEELITDAVQALVELVKNSYDADATWVKVSIETQATNPLVERYREAKGVIVVEDNGDGMSREVIENGWLTIANSSKRAQKMKGEPTRKGRTPTGDKGLGRLGTQRLAENVEIVTRTCDIDEEQYLAFSWRDFRGTENLSRVPVILETRSRRSRKQGTKLILSDLRDPDSWRGESNILRLQRSLSGMISPFQEVRDFVVQLEVDGKSLELAEIAQSVRETALLHYRLDFDGETFSVAGKARLGFLRPKSIEERILFDSLLRRDGGKALFDFLATKAKRKRPPQFSRSKSAVWFVEYGFERRLDSIDKVKYSAGIVANPGPFHGEVDAVSLDKNDLEAHVVDRVSEYRRLVRDLAGVRVYRDGFGIRVGEDWLGLGKQWTSATSYYGLKPSNVLGYVALTAKDNAALIETTSREGFQVTPSYENLYALMTDFVRFTGDAQDFLRRGTQEFLNQHKDLAVEVGPDDDPGDITRRIDEVASTLGNKREKLQANSGRLRAVAGKATSILEVVRVEIGNSDNLDESVQGALNRLDAAIAEVSLAAGSAEALLGEVADALAKASELKSLREVLDRRWDSMQGELGSLFESVSLGLTAEALSHEVNNIADGLAQRSAALLRLLQRGEVRNSTTLSYVEHVRSSVVGMRKQLAHLTPSLKYLRERREQIDLIGFLTELASFHDDRLKEKGVAVEVRSPSQVGVQLKINRGKLTQIFDNLILNAEYWLREAIRTEHIKSGVVTLTVEDCLVQVSDNGRGVDPEVERTLFAPFVTMKQSGEGRGLGLFVVQQLLDSETCAAILLPERNSFDRRYVFEIDLTGALCEKSGT